MTGTILWLLSLSNLRLPIRVRGNRVGPRSEIGFKPRKLSCFLLESIARATIYIETRLLQQDKATTNSIEGQLRASNAWSVAMDGDDERQNIIRVQQVILGHYGRASPNSKVYFRVDGDTGSTSVN